VKSTSKKEEAQTLESHMTGSNRQEPRGLVIPGATWKNLSMTKFVGKLFLLAYVQTKMRDDDDVHHV
jgi:hypothetical protein